MKMNWDKTIAPSGCIGGLFKVSNTSGGYHGLLKQWWDYYNTGTDILLVAEGAIVKSEFKKVYPKWNITTIDKYDIQPGNKDIMGDICKRGILGNNKYDLIICQATLEHVYDPISAMINMFEALNKNGILILHTHPPPMEYHPYPRDYLRFMPDWFIDLPDNLGYGNKIKLLELFGTPTSVNIDMCYKRMEN